MNADQISPGQDNVDVSSLIMVANVEAPPICSLSPNEEVTSPQSSYTGCYGLPYQDHNYGAPPPPTPPPSPGKPQQRKKLLETTIKSVKPSKLVVDRRPKAQRTSKKQKKEKRNGSSPVVAKEAASPSEPEIMLTETVIEGGQIGNGGDYSDSVTRCICSYSHDDGYMICCDQCQVWQHIDCMGIDRENIPEDYLCEQCLPRKVSRVRARMIQKPKRFEILRNSACEDENMNTKRSQTKTIKSNKQIKAKLSRKAAQPTRVPVRLGKVKLALKAKRQSSDSENIRTKKRSTNLPQSPGMARPKRPSKSSDAMLSVDIDAEESPWMSLYEQATANQYSADIQQLLNSHINNTQQQPDIELPDPESTRCQLRLLANGRRGLEVQESVVAETPLVEFRGKAMLQEQYLRDEDLTLRPQPFVLFYKGWDSVELCLDASSYGNEARFVRRSCVPNSEVRHLIVDGQLYLVLYSKKELMKGTEVTIAFDFDYKTCDYCVECACVRAQCPVRKAARKLLKTAPQSIDGKADDVSPMSPTTKPGPTVEGSLTKRNSVDNKKSLDLQVEIPAPVKRERKSSDSRDDSDVLMSPTEGSDDRKHLSREERKIEAYMKAFERMEKRQERKKEYQQKVATKPRAEPPPVETSPPEVVVSRPSKPAARRRSRNKSGPTTQRRRALSGATPSISEAEDSNQDSLLASTVPSPHDVGSTSVGTVGALSFSGFSKKKHLLEKYHEKGPDRPSPSVPVDRPLTVHTGEDDSMDFVKQTSSTGSSWAHLRRNSASNSQHSSGSLNATPQPTKPLDHSMGSAKKRWLRQAMEEGDTAVSAPPSVQASPNHPNADLRPGLSPQHSMVSGSYTPLSPGSGCDFVTPLKKRRLARESLSLDKAPVSPPRDDAAHVAATSAYTPNAVPESVSASGDQPTSTQKASSTFDSSEKADVSSSTAPVVPHTPATECVISEDIQSNIINSELSDGLPRIAPDVVSESSTAETSHISHSSQIHTNVSPERSTAHSMMSPKKQLISRTCVIAPPVEQSATPADHGCLSAHSGLDQKLTPVHSAPEHGSSAAHQAPEQSPSMQIMDEQRPSPVCRSISLVTPPRNQRTSSLTDTSPPPNDAEEPQTKKKVSLLEYRKRMVGKKCQPSSSIVSRSAPSTPGTLTSITLPSLPLFEHREPTGTAEKPKRPTVSLDERLKLEFGLQEDLDKTCSTTETDRDGTPPPPPPPLPELPPPIIQECREENGLSPANVITRAGTAVIDSSPGCQQHWTKYSEGTSAYPHPFQTDEKAVEYHQNGMVTSANSSKGDTPADKRRVIYDYHHRSESRW